MDRVTKRKSMPATYDFKIGEKCICWWTYPYTAEIRKIERQTKQHWILDNGYKFAKNGLNRAGFVGYSDTFIEPITEESLKFVCTRQMVDAIEHALKRRSDYDFVRDMYETLISNTREAELYSVMLLDKLLSSEEGKVPDHVE